MQFVKDVRAVHLLLFAMFLVLILPASGCKTTGNRTARQKKAIEKKMEKRQKEQVAAYEKAKERHRKIQSGSGKALLANADSHSSSLDSRQGKKKRFFLWRWIFGEKQDDPGCRQE